MSSYCPHTDTAPVEVRDHRTGAVEVVARICHRCLDRLPAGWGCEDCDWSEIRTFSGVSIVLTHPCPRHREPDVARVDARRSTWHVFEVRP